ncbi:Peptidase family M48 [Filimonas lacunae]|uniref:Peptidase family M48 n=1 Tax=Filimonas lacunae TaxID=477680 RepID=A0A173MQ39_9BACT|nr:M48 family metallopeptidase [Filimonas lacunae]BAV09795.1 peptidase, M48 family [Filimonas lacunae]SIS79061.1 Peptidase family M48 [Filimonas lacunae]
MQTLNPSNFRNIIPGLLLLLLTSNTKAQTNIPYVPLKDDSIAGVNLVKQVEQRYKQDVNTLKGSNKKSIADLYEYRLTEVKSMTSHKEVITDASVQQYLQSLTSLIINANSQLSGISTRFYFSRSAVPNAFSMGDGTIIFNVGLFTKLNSEAEVAFVLCHELAHLYLNHSNNRIEQYVNTMYSKDMQKELRKIQSSEYRQNAQLKSLSEKFSFNSSRHSRDHESEADSMGVVFLRNTRFNTYATVSALGILDTIDVETFNTNAFLQQTFTSKAYPFQTKWLEKEEGLLGGHATLETNKKLEDSLKTHPDCQLRIKAITSMVVPTGADGRQDFLVNAGEFTRLKKSFAYEIVDHYYNSSNLSGCFYFAVQMLQKNVNDPYVVAIIGKLFSRMYTLQKAHKLGSYTQQPAPYYSSNYNNLLQFIQNLYLEDMAAINYHFLQQYEKQGPLLSYEDFVYALTMSKQQNDNPEELSYWKNYYNKSFSPKKYSFN